MIRSLFETEDSPEEEDKLTARVTEIVTEPAASREPVPSPGEPVPAHEEPAGTAEAGSPPAETARGPEFAKSPGDYDAAPDDDSILELEPSRDRADEFRRMEEELAAVERELKAEREIERQRLSAAKQSAVPSKMEGSGETPVLSAFDRTRRALHEQSAVEFEKSADVEPSIHRAGQRLEEFEEPATVRSGDQSPVSDEADSANASGHFPWTPNIPTILDVGAEAATPGEPGFQPESKAEVIRQSGLAWTAATVLFGSIAFLLIIGWFADLLLGTSPWGVIAGIVLGSIIGFFQFFRLTSQILRK